MASFFFSSLKFLLTVDTSSLSWDTPCETLLYWFLFLSSLLPELHLPSPKHPQDPGLVLLPLCKLSQSLCLVRISKHFPTFSSKALKHQKLDTSNQNIFSLRRTVHTSVHLFPVLLSQSPSHHSLNAGSPKVDFTLSSFLEPTFPLHFYTHHLSTLC